MELQTLMVTAPADMAERAKCCHPAVSTPCNVAISWAAWSLKWLAILGNHRK
jgi:hypothetical protein